MLASDTAADFHTAEQIINRYACLMKNAVGY